MSGGLPALAAPSASHANNPVQAPLQDHAVAFPEATNQIGRRRHAPAQLPQCIVPEGGVGDFLRGPKPAPVGVGEQSEHPPRVIKARRGEGKDRAQQFRALRLRGILGQRQQHRRLHPVMQIVWDGVRLVGRFRADQIRDDLRSRVQTASFVLSNGLHIHTYERKRVDLSKVGKYFLGR